jgi:hypothetical protein
MLADAQSNVESLPLIAALDMERPNKERVAGATRRTGGGTLPPAQIH